MIKSLFEEDEKEEIEDSLVPKDIDSSGPADSLNEVLAEGLPEKTETPNDTGSGPIVPFEVEQPIGTPQQSADDSQETDLEKQIAAIEADITTTEDATDSDTKISSGFSGSLQEEPILEIPAMPDKSNKRQEEEETKTPVNIVDYTPDSPAETLRKTGMAYSAAIALFGSVVFMLIMGWFADLLLGIQPWGTVVGIVIGAGIGFLQFFRITSRIINPKKGDFARVSIANQESESDSDDAATDSTSD